ncbi:MAG: ArsR family transcriptional regulator [Candidatus Heimdallarchaeota archaeon]|nr:ArsR family transcriptional regulator [Candidatus Heimdallarchaeota archaeon]
MGNTIRRAILKRLSQEPCFALQIAKDLGVGQQLIAQHLQLLEKNDLIYSYDEDSPRGPTRKMYVLKKSLFVIIDLAPNLYNDNIISFDTKPTPEQYSAESSSFQKQLNSIEKLAQTDSNKLASFANLIKDLDQKLQDLTTERIALLYIRNAVMQNIAKMSNELNDHNVRRVFHTLINSPDLKLSEISSTLNLREESVRKIIKQLEDEFPTLK